ncbi:hypothetical protein PRIPAC_74277 [Pristionchus pacificus]|uniref:Uncharacterized protein n=1 Tax=Pristionchus pacificus TaxID=54126 RepID=A0A2A6B4Y8_PRIPA|nr:hypothetical protein PRIPAC_74277 [Pristionchus pacificus]|eukprot:PDM60955.1 hypothetical protein PRIPAC_54761 [Pristionchus pacificus]
MARPAWAAAPPARNSPASIASFHAFSFSNLDSAALSLKGIPSPHKHMALLYVTGPTHRKHNCTHFLTGLGGGGAVPGGGDATSGDFIEEGGLPADDEPLGVGRESRRND